MAPYDILVVSAVANAPVKVTGNICIAVTIVQGLLADLEGNMRRNRWQIGGAAWSAVSIALNGVALAVALRWMEPQG